MALRTFVTSLGATRLVIEHLRDVGESLGHIEEYVQYANEPACALEQEGSVLEMIGYMISDLTAFNDDANEGRELGRALQPLSELCDRLKSRHLPTDGLMVMYESVVKPALREMGIYYCAAAGFQREDFVEDHSWERGFMDRQIGGDRGVGVNFEIERAVKVMISALKRHTAQQRSRVVKQVAALDGPKIYSDVKSLGELPLSQLRSMASWHPTGVHMGNVCVFFASQEGACLLLSFVI
jgi:hypothetical protein